jgi:hypothetical protein
MSRKFRGIGFVPFELSLNACDGFGVTIVNITRLRGGVMDGWCAICINYKRDYDGSGDTLLISSKVISIYYQVYSFTGGAHGNSSITYLNFNAQTGDLLKLTDMVSDKIALKKMAELKFEKTQKEFAKDNDFEYDRTSYFWEKPFYLPANIAVTKTGLLFMYNPYEAAAYALGSISFELTWQELSTIAKTEIR